MDVASLRGETVGYNEPPTDLNRYSHHNLKIITQGRRYAGVVLDKSRAGDGQGKPNSPVLGTASEPATNTSPQFAIEQGPIGGSKAWSSRDKANALQATKGSTKGSVSYEYFQLRQVQHMLRQLSIVRLSTRSSRTTVKTCASENPEVETRGQSWDYRLGRVVWDAQLVHKYKEETYKATAHWVVYILTDVRVSGFIDLAESIAAALRRLIFICI